MAMAKPVSLGFVKEDGDLRLLASHYFPSKVGGRPAWLSLNPLQTTDELTCPKCSNPMVFVLQVYAPRDQKTEAFHRTLFVFACQTPGCTSAQDSSSFAIFRSQLPRANKFYSYDAYPDDPSEFAGD
jgi:pre-rRNA-processing protein TSR4